MILLIERNGSGWGGFYGKWIVDTESEVAMDIATYSPNQSSNRPKTIQLPDISLIHCCLETCPIKEPRECAMMDNQEDKITIISSFPHRVIWDESRDIKPDNEAMVAKIDGLLSYLGG